MASWEILPPEIMTDILVRLSVRSLMRLKTVSKHFSAIIKSQSFVKLHHSYKVEYNRLSLLAFLSGDARTFVLSECRTWLHFPKLGSGCRYIEGICNGLVLVITHIRIRFQSDLVHRYLPLLALWNPATQKSQKLPLPSYLGIEFNSGKEFKFGFGYDNKANDFKVVQFRRSVYRPTSLTPNNNDIDTANVYSFNTGAWKRRKNCIPLGNYITHHVHINGVLFWLGLNHFDGDFILSFNLGSEVFTKLAMPISPLLNNIQLGVSMSWKLGVYENDSLALLTVGTPTLKDVVVWVMKKDCDNSKDRESCWMKIHTLRLPKNSFGYRDVVYGFWNKHVIIKSSIRSSIRPEHVEYKLYLLDMNGNVVSKGIQSIAVGGNYFLYTESPGASYYLNNYVESLFPV